MKQLRSHLTYANIVATLALIVAVGGGTAMAVSGKIGAKQLKKNAVTESKVRNEAITSAKLRTGAVNTGDLGDRSITGPKLAPIQVVTATGDPGATAVCPSGTVLIGGGGFGTGFSSSHPIGNNSWRVGGTGSVTADALCL